MNPGQDRSPLRRIQNRQNREFNTEFFQYQNSSPSEVRPVKSNTQYNSLDEQLRANAYPQFAKTTVYDRYIALSSSYRDHQVYPNSNEFKINFEVIKNVVEVEMISAIIANQNSVLNEPFLVIEIEELQSNIIFTRDNINQAFALLPLKSATQIGAGYILPELGQNFKTILRFKTPVSSISCFTIRIKDIDGNLFDFGTDSTFPTPVLKALQNTFMFKIKTVEADTTTTVPATPLF